MTGAKAAQPTTPLTHTYNYEQDASLYQMNGRTIKTWSCTKNAWLLTNNRLNQEVAIGKRVETETASVSVPVEKERVVIERVTPTDAAVAPGELRWQRVARVEIYEEQADIHKEAFVREEVKVSK